MVGATPAVAFLADSQEVEHHTSAARMLPVGVLLEQAAAQELLAQAVAQVQEYLEDRLCFSCFLRPRRHPRL